MTGSLTISPVFQSTGIYSPSHHSLKISVRVSVMTSPPAFSISALTPSAPGAFPYFMLYIADFTSFAVGGSMLTSRSSSLSGMSSTSPGVSFFRMVSKCVFHSCVCFYIHVVTTQSASFVGLSVFLKAPASALVISYSAAIFCIVLEIRIEYGRNTAFQQLDKYFFCIHFIH